MRRVVDPGWKAFEGRTFSPAVIKRGSILITSGLNSEDENGVVQAPDDIVAQTEIIYEKLGVLLETAGATPADVMKTTDYILSHKGYRETAEIRRRFFGDGFPAATGVLVKELIGRGVVIEVEAMAVI